MISLKTLKRQVSILKNGNKMSQNIFCSSSADINPSDIVLKTAWEVRYIIFLIKQVTGKSSYKCLKTLI